MINAKDHNVVMMGTLGDLLSETTAILTGVYSHLKSNLGEKAAGEILSAMGKIAVDPETAEKGISELINIRIPTPPENEKHPISKLQLRGCNPKTLTIVYKIISKNARYGFGF